MSDYEALQKDDKANDLYDLKIKDAKFAMLSGFNKYELDEVRFYQSMQLMNKYISLIDK